MTSPTVLCIAHGFPPASGSGPNRALAFARYLPRYGWRPVVLTPAERWAANRDDQELPPELTVIRTPSWEPLPAPLGPPSPAATQSVWRGRHTGVTGVTGVPAAPRVPGVTGERSSHHPHGLSLRLRSHLGHARRFPDAHWGWIPFAVRAGLQVRADVLYSTSGPFSSHVVGLLLHRLTGTPWVAELRDGWYRWNRAIFPDYPAWRAPLERNLERAVIRGASRVVLVTDAMARAFRAQYPRLPAHHFAVVPNGFDPAQLSAAGLSSLSASTNGSEPPHSSESTFTVLHAGSLYHGRAIRPFLRAAAQLIDRDPLFAEQFRLALVGTLDSSAQREIESAQLARYITCRGYLDHAATLRAMREADLLLLVANTTPGAEATVPGKLFEYLAVGRPVLAIGPRDAASAEIVEGAHAGWTALADDPAAIAERLGRAFAAHTAGLAPSADPTQVARYDRRLQAGALARLFDDVSRG